MTDFSGLTKVSSGGRSADAPSYDFGGLTKVGSLGTSSDFSGLTKVGGSGSFVPEVAKGVAGGAVTATGTALKGAAGQNAAMLQSRIDGAKARIHIMDLIDKGEAVPVGSIADQDELGTADVYKTLSPEDRKAFRRSQEIVIDQAVQPGDVTKAPLYKAGQWAEDFSKLNFPAAKDYEGSWTRGISEGLGSTVPFIAAQAVGAGGIGMAMGSAMTAGSQIDDAIKHGATREQIIEAVKLGGIPGLTEQMPIEVMFSKIPLPQMGKFATVLGKVLSQAAAEGGQEGVQQLAQNLIAKYVYNPKQDINEDVLRSAAIGGIVGGGIKGVDVALGEPAQEKPSAQAGAGVAGGAAAQPVTEGAGGPPPPSAPSQDSERLNSPRLTAADRASPLPNDLIDDGKKIFEDALGKQAIDVPTSDIATPAMRAEADRRAADIATPAGQPAPSAIEHTIEGTLAPAEAASAPGAAPARLLSDAEFMGREAPVAQSAPQIALPAPNVVQPAAQPRAPAAAAPASATLADTEIAAVRSTPVDELRKRDHYIEPSNTDKPTEDFPRLPLGSAKIGRYGDPKEAYVEVLREFNPNDLTSTEGEEDIKSSKTYRDYVQWFRDGKEAPPIFVAESDKGDGKLFTTNRRRLLAAQEAGVTSIKGWFSPHNPKTGLPLKYKDVVAAAAPPIQSQKLTSAQTAEPAAQTALKQKIKAKRERAPLDLVQFLASEGGIADHKGEIASLGMKSHFVPGIGKLMRATGMNFDRAREKAEEAGYIGKAGDYQTTTVADLLDALDKNMRGQRVYAREDAGRAENRAAEKAVKTDSEEQARRDDFDQMVKENGLNDDEAAVLQAAVERGEWASEAIFDILERRAVAFVGKTRKSRTQKEPDFDIPFDIAAEDKPRQDTSDASRGREGPDAGRAQGSAAPRGQHGQAERAGSTPEGGKGQSALDAQTDAYFADLAKKATLAVAGDGLMARDLHGWSITASIKRSDRYPDGDPDAIYKVERNGGKSRDDVWGHYAASELAIAKEALAAAAKRIDSALQGAATRAANKPTVEPGADSKPQTVIPGAERISQQKQAQREADKPMRPKVPQKDAGALFDGQARSEKQDDLPFFHIPPDAAKRLNTRLTLPSDPIFTEAVANTPGAQITRDGLLMDLTRYQPEQQSGAQAVRTGVFYLPSGSPQEKHYRNPKSGYGGSVRVRGETLIRNPLFVKGGTGGTAPKTAYDALKGKGAYEAMRNDALKAIGSFYKRPTEEDIAAVLEKYGANGDLAYEIMRVSKEGNTLPYAVQENIVAHAVRAAGHDAMVGWSKGKSGPFISEVFDVRESMVPTPEGDFEVHPEFEDPFLKSRAIQPTDAFKAEAQAIGTRLRAELDRLGLKDIGLRISENLGMMVDGRMHAADGQYFQKLITIALDAENPDATLQHEAIHALRELSLFGKDEWAILERQSRKKWMEQHKIAEAYGAFPEWVQVEEGIAHAYGEWSRQGSGFDGIIVKAFRKIKAVLRAIARAFGKDFTSIEDVFAKIDSGEVGGRPGNVQFISNEITNGLFSIRRDERRATDGPAVSVIQAAATATSQRIAKLINGGKPGEETRAQYTMRKLVDYLHPVRTLIESVGGTVQDTMNAYLMARLADDTVIARIQDMHGAYVTPMVDTLADARVSLEEYWRYLYARHAEERNRVVGLRNEPGSDFHKAVTDPSIKGASGMSTNEANKILAKVNADPRVAGYRQAEAHLRGMISQNLLAQKNAGLISEESYKTLTEQWHHWVPLRGEEGIDENGNYSPGKGRGFDVRGKEFQGATGRFSEAENGVAWAISLAERAHMRGEHNNVGKAMLRFVAKYDPAGQSIAKVYWTGNAPGPMGIDKQPDVYQRVLDRQGKVADRKVAPSTLSPAMFAVKVGGQTFYIEFADENVGLALKKMGGAQLDAVSRVMRLWTGWQSLINTRANPAFIPINAIRDAWTGGIHLLGLGFSATESAKVLTTIPKAWAAIFRNARGRPGSEQWDTSLKEYIASGGKISFDRNGGSIEDSIKALGAEMDRALRTPGPIDIGRAVVKWLGDVNDAVESGMRLAAYAAMREKGRSPRSSALASRDLTVDFKKHGEIGPVVNAWVLFFNAALQGNFNVAANLLKSKNVRRAAYVIATSGILVDLLNRTLTGAGGDDDDNNPYLMMIRNEPWKMERSMIIFYGFGERDYISIPLPFGYNAIYHMGLQMGMVAHGDTKPMQAIADSARVTFDAYNPLGSGNLATMFLPSIATPALELWANKNFMGAPIYPEPFSNDHSPLSQHSKAKTSETAKTVAEGVNALTGGNEIEPGAVDIPPDVYDYLWGYVSGGIGRFLSQTVNVGQKVATGKMGEIEPNDIPVARSLYGRIGADTARSEFYKMREQVQTAKDHLGDYKAAGDAAETQDFIERNKVDVEAIGAFDAAEKRLRKIRKQRRRIEAEGGDTKALDEGERKAMDAARLAYARNAAKQR